MFPLSIYNTSISSSSHKGTVHSRTVLRKRTVERAEIYLRCPQRLEYRSRLHFYSALIEQRSEYCLTVCLSVCLSASISLEQHVRSSPNFSRMLPIFVARSSCGGVAICYVLSVLWMATCLYQIWNWVTICDPATQ